MDWKSCGHSTLSTTEYTKRACINVKLEPGYWLHVDADRDGKVDGDIHVDEWTRGKGTRGAVILVNCDADGDPPKLEAVQTSGQVRMEMPWRPRRMDCDASTIQGDDDLRDLAPLVIRRTVDTVSKAWQGSLSITDSHERIRVFLKTQTKTEKGLKTAYRQVLGKDVGSSYTLPNLTFSKLELFMAATEFPSEEFGGLIPINLSITENGARVFGHEIVVKVAPWMMYHHLNPTQTVFAADVGSNHRFLAELDQELAKVGLGPTKKLNRSDNHDRWMQDVMEVGYTHLPCEPEMPVILRTPTVRNMGSLQHWARNGLLLPGVGFVEMKKASPASTRDSLGNLECSPPVKVRGKDYKFGRIIYGQSSTGSISEELVQFLKAQRVQAPFPIDTGWLSVGHVDEIFSFCPMQDSPKKFRVLMASPQVAMGLLDQLIAGGYGDEPFFAQVSVADWGRLSKENLKIYGQRTAKLMKGSAYFSNVQSTVQGHIDQIKIALQNELGLSQDDFIDLPVLFREVSTGNRQYIAFTPGVVNMLVLTRANKSAHLVIPKPLAPMVSGKCVFENEIDGRLGKFKGGGLTYNYIDDFVDYHVLDGEIHCGTNSHRLASTEEFWWEQTDLN